MPRRAMDTGSGSVATPRFLFPGRAGSSRWTTMPFPLPCRRASPAQVIIEIGPVFGNAIRDGSGLLDVSDFANAQDFNAISAEINRRVEEQVFPVLAANATVGATVHFVGGVDVADSEGAPSSLNLVPVIIEFP